MRRTERIQLTRDELCHWIGMGDFELISPDGLHLVQIIYKGEPPRDDSYHSAIIDGHILPGHVWGVMFSFCRRTPIH